MLLAILFIDLCSLWLQSATTLVEVVPEVRTIGANTPVEVRASNPHGVRRLTVWIEQDGSRHQVFQQESPGHWWRWNRNQAPLHVRFETGKDQVSTLREGRARLVVTAVGDDFRSAAATRAYEVNIVAAH